MQLERPDDELARRLEAYASARLSPDLAARARMRERVLREAGRRLSASSAPGASPPLAGGPPPPAGASQSLAGVPPVVPGAAPAMAGPTTGSADSAATPPRRGAVVPLPARRRRILPALLAATLALALAAGGALAARPGGPLYEARLAIEAAFLPSEGDARAAADLARLEARLAEAVAAAANGDEHAVQAALAAYQQVVDQTAVGSGTSDAREAALEDALGRHLEVLNGLLSRVPAEARPAIEHAIEQSGKAVERIHADDGPQQPDPGAEPTREPPGRSAKPDRTPPAGPPSDRPSRAP